MIRPIYHKLIPPKNWKIPVIILVGIFTGLALYTFRVSKAHSYLSNDPKACVNCHIMTPQYATWSHSSHRESTTCNDCHVPHNNMVEAYFFKAKDGLRHATYFTMRWEPQVIQIKHAGISVVQENCIRCHSSLVVDSKTLRYTDSFQHYRSDRLCWDCHREVPHGRVNSLSSVPNARVPLPESPVPSWLQSLTKNN